MQRITFWLGCIAIGLLWLPCAHGQRPLKLAGDTVRLTPNTTKIAKGDKNTIATLGTPIEGKYYLIAQFDDIPTPLTQNKLKESGVQLTDYLGDYAYFAIFPAAGLEKAVKDVGLIALAPCKAEWKLNDNLRDGNIPDYARSQGGIGCVAYYYEGLSELWVERRLAQLGITNAHIVSIFTSIELTLSREQALQLAEEPWIKSIGQKSPPAELFELDHCSSLRCL